MPPISSSRLAPRTSCNSPAASIWASQVRRSCFGALARVRADWSAGRFIGGAFRSGGGTLERAARHGADEIAPIFGAGVDVFERINGGSSCSRGGLEYIGLRLAAVERRFGLCDPARPRLGATDAQARVGHHAILEPEARERHAERKVAGAAAELGEARTRVRRQDRQL